jgi:hypothetical protein
MRFLLLVGAAAFTSAVAVVSFKSFFPQHDALMRAAVREVVADIAAFRLSDLNPIQRSYNYVANEIASPRPNAALSFQSGPVVVGEFKMPTPVGIGQLGIGGGPVSRNSSLPPLHGTTARCGRFGVTMPCE